MTEHGKSNEKNTNMKHGKERKENKEKDNDTSRKGRV